MHDHLLRTALTVNAVLSGVTGLAMAALAGFLAAPLGIPTSLLLVVGVGLLPWSVALWWARSRDVLLRRDAVTAIVGDTAWVLASIAVLVASPGDMTTAGQWVVAVAALGVADCAVLQAVGLRRMLAGPSVSSTPTGRRPAVP